MKTILIETIKPIISCPYNKSGQLKTALKFWIDTGEVILIDAQSNADHVHADFISRYINYYQGGTAESPRYGGLFGRSVAEGFSIWADSVDNDGLYAMTPATKQKVEQMLAKDNGYSLKATKKIGVGNVLGIKITASAPASKKIRVTVLCVDSNTHAFKSIYATKDVTIATTLKTITLTGTTIPDCDYVVVLQDIKEYAPDLVDNSPNGHYEHEVFAVTVAK
jgi:hypothetical protein